MLDIGSSMVHHVRIRSDSGATHYKTLGKVESQTSLVSKSHFVMENMQKVTQAMRNHM